MNQQRAQKVREHFRGLFSLYCALHRLLYTITILGAKYLPLDLRPKKTRAMRRALTYEQAHALTLRQQKKKVVVPKFAVLPH